MNFHAAHAPHSVPALLPIQEPLYVVTCISNPVRYRSRYRLYRQFAKHVEDSGAILYTIECAFGDRPFEVTNSADQHHVQIRSKEELWNKENLMNLAVARLPLEAKYIATVDADFQFARPDWAQETVQQLQHYQVVQMFSTVGYLNIDNEMIRHRLGYLQTYQNFLSGVNNAFSESNIPPLTGGGYDSVAAKGKTWQDVGAPGAAWAYRREALNHLGGLVDFCILGSGDYFMAAGLIGLMPQVLPKDYSPGFKQALLGWQNKAERHVRRNVGIVPGTVLHYWHGRLSERGYGTREGILTRNQFNPYTDLKRDVHGLWQLDDQHDQRFIIMRDEIRKYFRSRNEDGVEE